MGHDVYVCYDDNDQSIANKVCTNLESNGLDCWIKSRDVGAKRVVDEMMDAIRDSTLMVLVFSENSKQSKFVNTEVDFAFGEDKPILVYKIDDSKIDGSLGFFIRNRPVVDASDNPGGELDSLAVKAKKIADDNRIPFYKKYRIPIIAAVAIILIAAVGIFALQPFDGGNNVASDVQFNPGEITLKITDFHVDDVRKESTSWNYSYFVGGTVSPDPTGSNCKIVADFYDKSGKLVDTTETQFDDAQKFSSGFVFGSAVSDTNNIKRVDVQLIDGNSIILAQSESQL